MDYENLLAKYIKWVAACEGVDYIKSGTYYHEEQHFTSEEWAELTRLAEDVERSEGLRE